MTGVSDDSVRDQKELGRQPRSVDCQVMLRNNGFQDGVPYFWHEIQNTILGLELSLFISLLRFICQIVLKPGFIINDNFSQYLRKESSPSSSFAFNAVLPCEVEAEINSLPPNKALGLYSCPVRILKDVSQTLSKPLAILLNKSVQSGIYPSKVKHAKIIPVFKNEDESDPNNYRPISLLSVFNHIFEKLMYKRLQSFIDKYDIFTF